MFRSSTFELISGGRARALVVCVHQKVGEKEADLSAQLPEQTQSLGTIVSPCHFVLWIQYFSLCCRRTNDEEKLSHIFI